MNKSKIFIYSMIGLFLIILISMFLFGDFVGKLTGFAVQEEFSRPAGPLFDINVFLEYNKIEAGESQIVTTKIINQGIEEAKDVLIIYTLWDRTKENKISEYSESVAVQTTLSLVKQIHIPEGLSSGNYLIDVEVEYGNQRASASASFVVKSNKSFFNYEWIILGIGIFISLILLYIVYLLRRSKNK